MSRRTSRHVAAVLLAAAIPFGCNAVLDNRDGHLDEGPLDATSMHDGSSDSLAEAAPDGSVPDAVAAMDARVERDGWQGAGDADAAEFMDAPTTYSPAEAGAMLVLWLQGDDGVQTAACEAGLCVVGWMDRSVWHNDAVLPAGVRAPTVSTVATHSAVSFEDPVGSDASSSLMIQDSTSLQVRSFTVIAVATDRDSINPHTGVLYSKQVTGQPPFPGVGLFLDCSNTQLSSASGQACAQIDIQQYVASSDVGLFDGTLRAYVSVFDAAGMTLTFGVNDEPWSTASASGIPSAGGAPAHVGGVQGAQQTMTGEIAELLLLDVPLSRTQWDRVYGYLRGRYGLP